MTDRLIALAPSPTIQFRPERAAHLPAPALRERSKPYRVRGQGAGAFVSGRRPARIRDSRIRDSRNRDSRTQKAGRQFPETAIQIAWRRLPRGAPVQGADGAIYAVLYPGRPADGPGPDFRDAVLRGPDGRVMRGDVEIHVRTSGWRAHGHHRDPRYNGVLFHVTGERPERRSGEPRPVVLTASGRSLHHLILAPPYPETPLEPERCTEQPTPTNPTNPADLAAAGDQRFLGKSAGASIMLREKGGDAAAWIAVLECLGYSRNRQGFRRVAERLPWSRLSDAIEAGADATSLLLWAGGFGQKPGEPSLNHGNSGPSGRSHGHRGLAPAWAAGGRPDNRPERRLAAAAVLAGRWRERGPLENIIEAVRSASGPNDLIEAFQVSADQTGARALIGRGRAGEIVVNAILPLVHAWSLLADRWDVTGKAFQLYRDHPKLPGNAITREMTALLAAGGAAPEIYGAREQQGLILMYRAMTAGPMFAVPPQES